MVWCLENSQDAELLSGRGENRANREGGWGCEFFSPSRITIPSVHAGIRDFRPDGECDIFRHHESCGRTRHEVPKTEYLLIDFHCGILAGNYLQGKYGLSAFD